jgi:ABC-type uncharacterized transport system YnjBCD substrate-binding protein
MGKKASAGYLKSREITTEFSWLLGNGGLMMETKLIREYAFRMARVFADKVSDAQRSGQVGDSLRLLEARRDFWAKVVQIPSDSEHWESVMSLIKLMSDRKASKTGIRALYQSLEEAMNSDQTASR